MLAVLGVERVQRLDLSAQSALVFLYISTVLKTTTLLLQYLHTIDPHHLSQHIYSLSLSPSFHLSLSLYLHLCKGHVDEGTLTSCCGPAFQAISLKLGMLIFKKEYYCFISEYPDFF